MSRPPIPKSLISNPKSRLIGLEYPGGSEGNYFNKKRRAAEMASSRAASAFDPSMAGRFAIAEADAKAARLRRSPPSLSTVHDELFNEAPAAAAAAAAPLRSIAEIKADKIFEYIEKQKKHIPSENITRLTTKIMGLFSEIAGLTSSVQNKILNSQNEDGYTPLCFACDQDHDFIALQLIKNPITNIYIPHTIHKDTPLIYASRHGLVDVVKSLLERNTKQVSATKALEYINSKGMAGKTALHNACSPAINAVNKGKDQTKYNNDKETIFNLLIANGASLDIIDDHSTLASKQCETIINKKLALALAAKKGGYRATRRDKKYLKRYKQGKSIGFTMRASLKAKGLIPRANGTRRVSKKYK